MRNMNITITNEEHHEGEGYNFCTALVQMNGRRKKYNVTYNVETDHVTFNRWFEFEEEEWRYIIAECEKHFREKYKVVA